MSNQTPQPTLQYPVVVRQDAAGQFTAEAVGLPELRATCSERDEAIRRVRLQLCQWFASGQLVQVDVPTMNPLLQYAGWAKDDPDYEQYLEEIRRYREEVDAQFHQEETEKDMLQYLLDTDHLTLFDLGHPQVTQRFAAQPADTVGVSAVTVEESLRGRLALLARAMDGPKGIHRYGILLNTLAILCRLPCVAYDQGSETHFQRLLALKLRIGTQDTKIAAVTLANNLTLLTRNRRDFVHVPGIKIDDWSV